MSTTIGTIGFAVRWADNTAELKTHLKQGLDQIEATKSAVDKMASSLGGDRLLRAAHNAAAAIQQIGGAGKLTGAEAQRMNALFEKAIAKATQMGQVVPTAFREIAAATVDARRRSDETIARIGQTLGSFSQGARTIGLGLSAALTAPIVGAAAAAVKFGIDAVESENLVAVSFGNMKQAADAWSKQLSKDLGLNEFELRKTAGTIFNMTTSMGVARDAAFDMSTGVAKLAADMASFRNIPMDEALTKIRSGLTGETEPLKAIGILVDEATVKAEAYRVGIAKQGETLTQTQKVMARWSAIMRQTVNDQGDLARTIDSPANQLRIMKTRLEEAATALGVQLMPYITKVTGFLADLTPKVKDAVDWFGQLPAPVKETGLALAGIAAAAGPGIYVLGSFAGAVSNLIPLLRTLRDIEWAAGLTRFAGLIGVGGPIALGLAAAGGALFMFNRNFAEYKEHIEHLSQPTKDLAGHLRLTADQLTALRNRVGPAMQSGSAAMAELAKQTGLTQEELKAVAGVDLAPLTNGFKLSADAMTRLGTALGSAGGGQSGFGVLTTDLKAARAEIAKLSGTEAKALREALQSGAFTMEELHQKTGLSDAALKLFKDQMEDTAKGTKKADDELKKFNEDLAKNTAEVRKIEQRDAFGFDPRLPFDNRDIERAEKRVELARQIRNDIERTTVSSQFGYGALLEDLAGKFNPKEIAPKLLSTLGTALQDSAKQLPTLLIQAFTGGGNVKGAFQAIGTDFGQRLFGADGAFASFTKKATGSLSNLFGKTIGGALGAAIPGIGSLIVPAVGALVNGFKKLFGIGPSEAEKTQKAIKKWSDELKAGGTTLDQLRTKATAAGYDLDKLLSTRRVKDFEAELKKLDAALKFQDESMQMLDEATRRWGFTIGELGPAFQKQQLGEQVKSLYSDYKLLTGALIPTENVLRRMAGIKVSFIDKAAYDRLDDAEQKLYTLTTDGYRRVEVMNGGLVEFFQNAARFGYEIPLEMKPIFQGLVDLGELYDENGDKVTDLKDENVTFAMTVSQALQSIATKLDAVIDAILRGFGLLPPAAQRTADGINRGFDSVKPPPFTNNSGNSGGAFGNPNESPTSFYPGSGGMAESNPINDPDNWVFTEAGFIPKTAYASVGGIVRSWGLQRFSTGGIAAPRPQYLASGGMAAPVIWQPRGTDTVPAMLSPGETVRTAAQEAGLRSALNGGGISMPLNANVTIQAWDGVDVMRVVKSDEFGRAFAQTVEYNKGSIRRVIARVADPQNKLDRIRSSALIR